GKRTREQNPALQETMMRMMSRQSREGVIAALAALRDRPDSTSTLGTMTARTLIVVGEDDVITPPSDSRAMLEMLPKAARAQRETTAGAGPVTGEERPAAGTRASVDSLALGLRRRRFQRQNAAPAHASVRFSSATEAGCPCPTLLARFWCLACKAHVPGPSAR